MDGKINLNECTAKQAENKPKTLEELFVKEYLLYRDGFDNLSKLWVDEKQNNASLQTIVDTLKKHATLEKGTVCIFISESKKEDRDFIVKALELKEEEKPNE